MIKKICSYSVLFCLSSLGLLAIEHTSDNSLTISRELNFEIEIESALEVDLNPVDLDFGTLVRGTNQVRIAKGDLKFNSGFKNDVKVSIEYEKNGDEMPEDKNYAKYKIKHKDVTSEKVTENDTLDVYIRRVDSQIMKMGETTIPIIGEIRSVSKEAKLGKYEKTIKATVFVTEVAPTNKITPKRRLDI